MRVVLKFLFPMLLLASCSRRFEPTDAEAENAVRERIVRSSRLAFDLKVEREDLHRLSDALSDAEEWYGDEKRRLLKYKTAQHVELQRARVADAKEALDKARKEHDDQEKKTQQIEKQLSEIDPRKVWESEF